MTTETTDTGLYEIHVEDIRFPGGFGEDVAAMADNRRKPIIAIERPDHYRLIDGWGRVSGLLNSGAEMAHAILVSEEDIASRSRPIGGDDEEWNRAMWTKYAPRLTYCGTTN